MSIAKYLALGLVLALTGGCRLEIAVPEGGKVITKSGDYECLSDQKCSIDIYNFFFKEDFVARSTIQGYLFSHWRQKSRAFCGNQSTNPCTVDSSYSALHPKLAEILLSDETFYLEPVFAKPDSWFQSGDDIAGRGIADYAGESVSLSADGTRLAIVAGHHYSKFVRVYQWTGIDWSLYGLPLYLGDSTNTSVYLSANGSRLAIFSGGEVKVYAWSGLDWQQLGEKLPTWAKRATLSADGNRVAISTYYLADPIGDEIDVVGAARVYYWSGNNWQQLGEEIVAEGNSSHTDFGQSVSLSAKGNHLSISAKGLGSVGSADYVLVYHWSDAKWHKLGSPIFSEGISTSDFPQTVALSAAGHRLAIGTPTDLYGQPSGLVRVYQWLDADWRQLGGDIEAEPQRGFVDYFGSSVSLSGNGSRVAIGAPRSDSNGDWTGLAQIYEWSGNDWLQLGRDLKGEAYGDRFGDSVSISRDGDWLAVGVSASDTYFFEGGLVKVYGAPIESVTE